MGAGQRKEGEGVLADLHRQRVELLRGLLAGVVLCLAALGAVWLLEHWGPAP